VGFDERWDAAVVGEISERKMKSRAKKKRLKWANVTVSLLLVVVDPILTYTL
jgi:hypothetical protein